MKRTRSLKLGFTDVIWGFLKELFDPVSIFRSVLFSILLAIFRRYKSDLFKSWKGLVAFSDLYTLTALNAFLLPGAGESSILKATFHIYDTFNFRGMTAEEVLYSTLFLRMVSDNLEKGPLNESSKEAEYLRLRLIRFYGGLTSALLRAMSFPFLTILCVFYSRKTVLTMRKRERELR